MREYYYKRASKAASTPRLMITDLPRDIFQSLISAFSEPVDYHLFWNWSFHVVIGILMLSEHNCLSTLTISVPSDNLVLEYTMNRNQTL